MSPQAQLLTHAANGNDDAWRTIVATHSDRLRAIGATFRLSSDDIADAMQATWLSAFQHIHAVRDPAKLPQWLGTIMRNRCLETLSTHGRRRETHIEDWSTMDTPDDTVSVETEVLDHERNQLLREAIDRLRGRERELATVLSAQSLSYSEISTRLSMPIGSIGPTRDRACRHLRLILTDMNADNVAEAA